MERAGWDEGLELLSLSVVVVRMSMYFFGEVCERSVERLVVVDGVVQSVAEVVLEVALAVLLYSPSTCSRRPERSEAMFRMLLRS